jgi:hypothetical protein
MSLYVIYRQAKTKLGALELDAALRETHTLEAEATKNPVEEGFAVTDHLQLQPRTYQVDGVISNTPIIPAEKVTGRYEMGQPGRAFSAYEELKRMRTSRQLVTLVTELEKYDNMLMTSLIVPRGQNGEVLEFTASFRELAIVRTQTVTVPKLKQKVKQGQVAKKTRDDTAKIKPNETSLLLDAAKAVKKALSGGGP